MCVTIWRTRGYYRRNAKVAFLRSEMAGRMRVECWKCPFLEELYSRTAFWPEGDPPTVAGDYNVRGATELFNGILSQYLSHSTHRSECRDGRGGREWRLYLQPPAISFSGLGFVFCTTLSCQSRATSWSLPPEAHHLYISTYSFGAFAILPQISTLIIPIATIAFDSQPALSSVEPRSKSYDAQNCSHGQFKLA